MIDFFYAFLGDYATRLINFYRENQTWLNLFVLSYGILLALAHRNVLRLEQILREKTGLSDMAEIRRRIENDEMEGLDLEELKRELRIPLLASHFHLSFYRVTKKSILRILRKKYPGGDNP